MRADADQAPAPGAGDASITRLQVGALATCCYVVAAAGGGSCVLVDPGADADAIAAHLRRAACEPELILLTHSHFDHVGAVDALVAAWPRVTVAGHAECARRLRDPLLNYSPAIVGRGERVEAEVRVLQPGTEFPAAGLNCQVHHLPGHAPGHLVYHLPALAAVFCGDTVFAGGVGRSDLPGGDHALLVGGILQLLRGLPGATTLYPGHGPRTTVGRELAGNPFLRA